MKLKHSFFADAQQSLNWEGQLNKCQKQLQNVYDANPTNANKQALEVVQSLQEKCEGILNNSAPSLAG